MKFRILLCITILLLALTACTQPTAAPSATLLPPTSSHPTPTYVFSSDPCEQKTFPTTSMTGIANTQETIPTPTFIRSVSPTERFLTEISPDDESMTYPISVVIWANQVGLSPEMRAISLIPSRVALCVDGQLYSNDGMELGDGLMGSAEAGRSGPYYLTWATPVGPGYHEVRFMIVTTAGDVLEYAWQFTVGEMSTPTP